MYQPEAIRVLLGDEGRMAAAHLNGTTMEPDRFGEQISQIVKAMGTPLAIGKSDDGYPLNAYEKGFILARRSDAEGVAAHVRSAGLAAAVASAGDPATDASLPRSGVVRIQVGDPRDPGPGDAGVTTALEALRKLNDRPEGPIATRNHIVSITTGGVNSCPGDEPVPVDDPPNPALAEVAYDPGTAVPVLVIDTGLVHDYTGHTWMAAHVSGGGRYAQLDEDGYVQQYVGHGTFIGGLINTVAPNTDVEVSRTLTHAGAILEDEFGERVLAALEDYERAHGRWPAIISLSAGVANGETHTLLGLEEFMRRLADHPRTLLVAAAGNNGSDTPFWPAASALCPCPTTGWSPWGRSGWTAPRAPASPITVTGSRSTRPVSASWGPSPASTTPPGTGTSTPPSTGAVTPSRCLRRSTTTAPAGSRVMWAGSASLREARPTRPASTGGLGGAAPRSPRRSWPPWSPPT
ncbi:S8/S53 family peptidase [Sphaerisporangium viridialbum]|uniref:S8/S53 family peptidase n=1 Tax=Sphaerisporangium viridialbum TaxID=46189 RepID=UPI003C7304FE